MANSTSAILAINSLDRYITLAITTYSEFFATWANGSTTLTLDSGEPFVGATITSAGFAFGTTITAVAGLTPGSQITISLPTTAASTGSEVVFCNLAVSNANQPTSSAVKGSYYQGVIVDQTVATLSGLGLNGGNNCNNFTIQSPAALIYGYVRRIIISQIQLSYNIPTVCLGKNDTLWIQGPTINDPPEAITIPYGFYYADELASVVQNLLQTTTTIGASADITVTFQPRFGFVFTSTSAPAQTFCFPSDEAVAFSQNLVTTSPEIQNQLKTYKLMGITALNSGLIGFSTTQVGSYPNFIYTPFIDIYSDVLTNYQSIKDTTTFVNKNKGLVARIYLSGTGNIQETGSVTGLGTAPFIMTADLNTPKVIEWSPDVAVPTVDFRLLDCYGDLIPGPEMGQSSEFQMTLLCTEEG
jgi:hypothetical protein